MKENLERLLRDRQKEITDIVLRHPGTSDFYNGRGVRIIGCPDTFRSKETPVTDVLINLDQAGEFDIDLIVCFRKRTSTQFPQRVSHRSDGGWGIFQELADHFGCTADVTNELGFKNHYPVTYNKTRTTHKWDF